MRRSSHFPLRDLEGLQEVHRNPGAIRRHCSLERAGSGKGAGVTTQTLTFTSADHKVTIDTSEATSNDMMALVLPGKLACKSTLVQVPEVYLLPYTSSVIQKILKWNVSYIWCMVDERELRVL